MEAIVHSALVITVFISSQSPFQYIKVNYSIKKAFNEIKISHYCLYGKTEKELIAE